MTVVSIIAAVAAMHVLPLLANEAPNARVSDIDAASLVEETTTTVKTTIISTGNSNGLVTNTTLSGANANGTFTRGDWRGWNKTQTENNATVTSSMVTMIYDFTHQLHLIQLEVSRKRELYANYRNLAQQLRVEAIAKKNKLGRLSDGTYNQIVQHNRVAQGLQGWMKYLHGKVYDVQAQYQALFQKQATWHVVAAQMSLRKQLQVFQLKQQEERRKAMVAAVSLYDNWLDIKYQDSMEGVTVGSQDEHSESNEVIRQRLTKQAMTYLDEVTNMPPTVIKQGPKASSTTDATTTAAPATNSSFFDLGFDPDAVAKEHIQKIVTHPSAMLMLHDPHYVKHGHFKKVMNPKLQETVHDMVADAHTMIDMWKNTKHEL